VGKSGQAQANWAQADRMILSMTADSVKKAATFILPPQRGQIIGSTS